MVMALLGGALVGLAASVLLLADGRVMGASGIVGGLLRPSEGDWGWRAAFLVGMAVAGAGAAWFAPAAVGSEPAGPLTVMVAGLLVGFGTRLGNGCTSGHGVCGLSRRSPRSLASVLTFIGTGVVVVTLVRWLGGAA